MLESRGIAVSGPAVDFDDVAADMARRGTFTAPRVLDDPMSPPLREIATVMMKVSQNLYAETLLKTVGAARGGLGTVAAGRGRAAGPAQAPGACPTTRILRSTDPGCPATTT